MAKLKKRQIEALKVRERDYFVWDSELPGLSIRVFPTGANSSFCSIALAGLRGG